MLKARKIVAVVVVVIAVATAAMFAFDRFALGQTYARVEATSVSILPVYEDYRADYPRTDEQFELDGYTLRGHVYGAGNDKGLIVFRHGIFSQHQDYLPFIASAVDAGWRVFAYDAIGCGESDGDSTLGMSQSPLDVAAAVDYARENGLVGGGPLVLWGHSWGGYGVAAALALRPDVDGCITMSGFDSPMKILDSSAAGSFGVFGKLQYPLIWLSTFLDFGENADISASGAIASSGVPALVVHGYGDAVVSYEGASIAGALERRWQQLAGSRISIVTKAESGRDGHNDYFYSRESQQLFNSHQEKIDELLGEGGKEGVAAAQAYRDSVDVRAANAVDPSLLEDVLMFLDALDGSAGRTGAD